MSAESKDSRADFGAGCLPATTAPLFEEKQDARRFALFPYRLEPFLFHCSSAVSAFTANDHPVNSAARKPCLKSLAGFMSTYGSPG
jgi:hypothetical protein